MRTSKALLAKAGILPQLKLGIKLDKGGVKPTGPHRVKVLADKVIRKADINSGQQIEWVRYLLEENGEKKTYDTKQNDKDGNLSYLVQRFAEVKEGDEVILEMKKRGVKNYIQIIPVEHNGGQLVEADEEYNDEPAPEPEQEMEVEEA